jgi:hypothetical protein
MVDVFGFLTLVPVKGGTGEPKVKVSINSVCEYPAKRSIKECIVNTYKDKVHKSGYIECGGLNRVLVTISASRRYRGVVNKISRIHTEALASKRHPQQAPVRTAVSVLVSLDPGITGCHD